MFKSLQDFFNKKSATPNAGTMPADLDIKLAAATLMFEMIRSDGKIEPAEIVAMSEILREQFKFSEEDLKNMLELAQKTAIEATSLQGFTRQICDSWGNAKRVKLLEHLWIIALADTTVDAHERHLVRKVAGLLYLNEMQIVQAKESAKARLGIEDF